MKILFLTKHINTGGITSYLYTLSKGFIKKGNEREEKLIKGIDNSGLKQLIEHSWPGNIRELENAIEHAFVICNTDRIQINDLPVEITKENNNHSENDLIRSLSSEVSTMLNVSEHNNNKNLTKEILIDLLDQCNWNKAEVGRRINKSRTSVWKYMKKWDIPLQKQV